MAADCDGEAVVKHNSHTGCFVEKRKKRKSKIVEFKYVNKALVLQVSLWQTVQAAGPRCCGVYIKRWSRLA